MKFSPMWPIWAEQAEKKAAADAAWRDWILAQELVNSRVVYHFKVV